MVILRRLSVAAATSVMVVGLASTQAVALTPLPSPIAPPIERSDTARQVYVAPKPVVRTVAVAASSPVSKVLGVCKASYYSDPQRAANGEWFNPNALTAAHKSLPFNTRLRVTNRANGKSVVVRINDRGPYVTGRCLDLSLAAFKAIGNVNSGVVTVSYAKA